MTKIKPKLELTWIGKDKRPKLEPRILLEDPEKSCHARQRITENDIFDNRLIFGDNLLALKALEQEFAGKVKCVFIDPPYNTGSAFTHYDDGLEHSIWLSLMRDRLEIIRNLLSKEGSLWITIDDNEAHYLKVLCDYVTTQNLSADQLQALSEEVGEGGSLLVLCSAFRGVSAARAAERWPNLTIKKIPRVVLSRCEWGHDDYSLNVQNLPMAKPEPEAGVEPKQKNQKNFAPTQATLFGANE